jgi:hypothetical protein
MLPTGTAAFEGVVVGWAVVLGVALLDEDPHAPLRAATTKTAVALATMCGAEGLIVGL